MRIVPGLGLIFVLAALVACERAAEPPVSNPALVAHNEEVRRVAAEREAFERRRAERAAAGRQEAARAADAQAALEAERARACASQRARLAELEPVVTQLRAERERAARKRAEDESWVRENCRWENDPRYALELQRRSPRDCSTPRYELTDRFVGFARSAPRCPKSATKGRLAVAAEIANKLASGGSIVASPDQRQEQEWAWEHEYDTLRSEAGACGDSDVPVYGR